MTDNPYNPDTEADLYAAYASATGEQPKSRVKLVRLSDVKREHIDWLWQGYIARGKLHVIDGDPGLGKSTATADLAARITAGKPWPDGQPGCTPAGVVLLSAEDGLGDTIRPRLEAAGADLDRVVALTGITSWDEDAGELYERMPALPGDIGRIRAAVEQVGAALVIIDPLMAYLGGDVNSHRDQDVRRALAPLAKMAEETGAAIKLIRHNTKGGGNNALYRGGGSIGIIGAARLGFTFARDPEDEHRVIVACTKANITAIPQSLAYRLVDSPDHGCARVEWHDGPVGYTAADLLAASHESADDRDDRNDAAAWLRGYLLDNAGEAEAGSVLKAGEKAGFQKHTLQRARKRAGVKSEKAAFDAGWMWRLDDEGDTKMTKATEHGALSSSSPSLSPSDAVTFADDPTRCPRCNGPVWLGSGKCQGDCS
ncbi:AAA family ATPase [Micromonospora sp. STR1_7]|uniref:AAA family ATPase n=1 Tax=Micromonospora parastrephiae TaxID=2806101 RepID=A0ABS1XUE2_9ACTN|nr:AAA family ATPase [Micromonospora parastrephiae]MBM0232885.1 AAA family ATPase [Micromonospora parastrephiae]